MTCPKSIVVAAAIAAALPLLASCAPAGAGGPGADALSVKEIAALEKELGGKIAGEPQDCLSDTRSDSPIRVSDGIVLYRVTGKLTYRNDLRGSCPGFSRGDNIMIIKKLGARICKGDVFHLADRSSGFRGATCAFGEFVPYRKPEGNAG